VSNRCHVGRNSGDQRSQAVFFVIVQTSSPDMASSCHNLIAALKDCLKYSDCVMKDGHRPSDCLKHHYNGLPEECQSLRKATFECKRGMVSVSKSGSYISLKEGCDSWICESDLEGTSWGPSSSTRQRPRPRRQNYRLTNM
jgi:cytochrome c oxidase assembly factor 5